jgi:hypothetical protein
MDVREAKVDLYVFLRRDGGERTVGRNSHKAFSDWTEFPIYSED